MKKQDRKNLISGWPVYLLCVVLLTGMVILYRQNLSKHGNESLPILITKNLTGTNRPFESIDDVINSRKTWEPVLPDWQDKKLPNLTFVSSDRKTQKLSDFDNRQIILIIGATWFHPFKIQLNELQDLINNKTEDKLVLIAVTAESPKSNQTFLYDNPYPFDIYSVESLPEPYSIPDGFPSIFFIDSQRRLMLAAVGLIPLSHAQAILQFSITEHEQD